jgi:NAD-dependent deacetylase
MEAPWGNLFILTGAGLSAESGLGTFRDKDGLWTRYNLGEVASLEGYLRNPSKVLEFYNARRRNLEGARANAAHLALAQLEAAYRSAGKSVFICTQNVDDLHEQAGSQGVLHMHGELRKARCGACGAVWPCQGDLTLTQSCAACHVTGHCRPHIVWFGEAPFQMDEIALRLKNSDLFVSIGTSGSVYPAAGFVREAKSLGIYTIEINLEPSDNAEIFDDAFYGPASTAVPEWVQTLLRELR